MRNQQKYDRMEELIELIEDIGFWYLASERELKSKPSDYIDVDIFETKTKKKK